MREEKSKMKDRRNDRKEKQMSKMAPRHLAERQFAVWNGNAVIA